MGCIMGVTVATPVRSGDYLLVSQFFNGSMMMRLNSDRPDATLLWKGKSRSEFRAKPTRFMRW
ncbi:MAG: hypothetical protein Ct9H300mP25_08660 [Acidobacteriota bacterium]|nr:MAG: hypothetical protein Ct9H300mP25_08660 [Acidobacteriota bacterium]